MSGVTLKTCQCKHEYQDKAYGYGIRLMNVGGTKDSPKYSCTVCGNQPKSSVTKKSK